MLGLQICKKNVISLYFSILLIVIGLVNSDLLEDPLYYQIYQSYIKALDIEEGTVSARRVFSNNRNYEIHVMKLEEVNGKKRHNLMVRESNSSNPLIYISNPVETKVPHAYLTFEEFKKELTDRVMSERQKFVANASKAIDRRLNFTNKLKPLDKAREIRKFKHFLDRLINLRDEKTNVTKEKSKKHKITVSNTMDAKKIESPLLRIFTLETDTESTVENTKQSIINKGTVISEQSTNKNDPIETTTIGIEISLQSPTRTPVIEYPTETEVTIESIKENPESTREMELESTHTTAKSKMDELTTKRSTLGRPLVWIDDENQNDE